MMNPQFANPILQEASDQVLSDPVQSLKLCDEYLLDHQLDRDCSRIQYDAYDRLQDWKNAVSAANNIISKSPNPRMGYFDRARAHYNLGNYADAAADAQTAINFDDTGVLGNLGHRMIAMSHAAQGHISEAIQIAQTMPEIEVGEWYAPVNPLPAGTKAQFTATVERMAQQVKREKSLG